MTTPNTQEEKELTPIEAIKRAIGFATFSNSTEVGGIVYKLLDSLSQDLIFAGAEYSERTEDYAQELIDCLAEDISEYATPDPVDEEDEDDDNEDDEDDIFGLGGDDDDDDDDNEDDLSDEEEDNFMEDSAEDEDESDGVSQEPEGAAN